MAYVNDSENLSLLMLCSVVVTDWLFSADELLKTWVLERCNTIYYVEINNYVNGLEVW